MVHKNITKTIRHGRVAASFFVPMNASPKVSVSLKKNASVAMLIPTFRPNQITYKLVKDVLSYNPIVQIVIIDDNTPLEDVTSSKIFSKIRELQKTSKNITLLRTPHKHLKASALNFGLEHLANQKTKPAIVVTVDDDVVINDKTLAHLIRVLHADSLMGAVCTSARIKNKKTNLLTRLQSLEYHGFNITKISDNDFLLGPLVMPGMLTAFRYDALRSIGGFSADKLLEDYDVTVRIKNVGFKSAIVSDAIAWTYAPETLKDLGKQRIRWSYGGLMVIKDFHRNVSAVFQDLLGHALFLSLFTLIVLSFVFSRQAETPSILVYGLIGVALLHFIFAYAFNLISLKTYAERDRKDWAIKLSILPEFAYSNLLSLILIGSYIFLAFNLLTQERIKFVPGVFNVRKLGLKGFSKIGYSDAWGTRI